MYFIPASHQRSLEKCQLSFYLSDCNMTNRGNNRGQDLNTISNKPALGLLVFLRDQKDSSNQDQEGVFVPQDKTNPLHYRFVEPCGVAKKKKLRCVFVVMGYVFTLSHENCSYYSLCFSIFYFSFRFLPSLFFWPLPRRSSASFTEGDFFPVSRQCQTIMAQISRDKG